MKTHNRHLIILVTLAALMLGLGNSGWGQTRADIDTCDVWPPNTTSSYWLSNITVYLYANDNGTFTATWPNTDGYIPANAGGGKTPTVYRYIGNTYVNKGSSSDKVKIVFVYEGDEDPIKFNGYISYVNGTVAGRPLTLYVDAKSTRTKPTVERYSSYTGSFIQMALYRHPKSLTIKGDTTTLAKFIIDGGSKGLTPSTPSNTDIKYTATAPSGRITAQCPLMYVSCGVVTMTNVTLQNNWNTATSSSPIPDGDNNSNTYNAYSTRCNKSSGILFEATGSSQNLICTMTNCTIQNCYSACEGAAMSFHNRTTGSTPSVTMNYCTVQNCFANANGGGSETVGGIVRLSGTASSHRGTLTATHCTFSGNYNNGAAGGGAIYWPNTKATTQPQLLTLENCTITGNHSLQEGGGVYCEYAVMKDCTITGNEVRVVDDDQSNLMYEAGGVHANTQLTLSGTMVIKGNTARLLKTDGTVVQAPKPSDVCFSFADNTAFVTIGEEGLDCGSCIGIFKIRSGAYYKDYHGYPNPYGPYPYYVNKIAQGEGANAAANCLYAYRNHIFFDDDDLCHVFNTNSISVGQHYYNNTTGTDLFFVYKNDFPSDYPTTSAKSDLNSWHDYAASTSSDCTIVGGYVTEVKSAAGLAYFSKDVLTKDYSGKTVYLTADINLENHNWEPIGCRDCDSITSKVFKGTFDGQGHTIKGLTCPYPYHNVALFGAVNGTIKNLLVVGGSLSSSYVDNMGGLVGELQGGTVYNCMAAPTTLTGNVSTTKGALVGTITSGTVKNCYAISNNNACGSGTVTNCYVRNSSGTGTATNVGSSGNTSGAFTATSLPYTYGTVDNTVTVGSTPTPLVKLLNQWVDSQSSPTDLAHWARPTTTTINGDYPILKMSGSNAVAAHSSTPNELHYGDVNTLMTSYNNTSDAIYLYGSKTGVNAHAPGTSKLYIDEDAAITQTDDITAYVGVTLKNTQASDASSWDWHMFSPAISAAPLGVNYPNNNQVDFGVDPTYTFNTSGYLPTIAEANYSEWDYYCYYEPQYHWINLKRNGNSHWHEDAPYGTHDKIHYQATPSATVDVNESTLVPGKGYLMAAKRETFLQCEGTLNNANVNIAVTTDGPYRTGYNFLGNPYQSYLDFDAFAAYTDATHNNNNLWDGNTVTNASYVMLDKDGYTSYAYGASANSFGAHRYLHPHQGFMIIVKGSGTTATFDNTMRNTTATAAFRDEHINYPLVNLIVTEADGKRDLTTVELGRPDKGGAFKAYDLHRGKGCIYTRYEGEDYAIAFTQPGITEVGIRFETTDPESFTMTWDTENGEFAYLHLIDNMTGADIDCLSTTEYRFTATPDDYKSRFRLVFDYTGIEENEEDGPSTGSGTFAFQMGDELVVNGEGTLEVIDMLGRVIKTETLNGIQSTTASPTTAGVYVLRLKNKEGRKVQKIVIR